MDVSMDVSIFRSMICAGNSKAWKNAIDLLQREVFFQINQ